jgi:hypothetical protein
VLYVRTLYKNTSRVGQPIGNAIKRAGVLDAGLSGCLPSRSCGSLERLPPAMLLTHRVAVTAMAMALHACGSRFTIVPLLEGAITLTVSLGF